MKRIHEISLHDNLFKCNEDTDVMHAICAQKVGNKCYGCGGGGCGVCKAEILSGQYQIVSKMSREYVSAAEEAEGIVLLCCIQPRSNLSIRYL